MVVVTLLKRACPYCNDLDSFVENRNVLAHCHRFHNRIIKPRPRALQNLQGQKLLSDKNKELHPNAPIEISCPSCTESFRNKTELALHVDENHLVFSIQHEQHSMPAIGSWSIGNTRVSQRFQDFHFHCLRDSHSYMDIDRYFDQLLALSNILVLQKRNRYESIPTEYFSPTLLTDMRKELIESSNIRKIFDSSIATKIKNILKDYKCNVLDKLDARIELLKMAKEYGSSKSIRCVILTAESLILCLKDIDLAKLPECHLGASYIHPIMQALLAEDDMAVAHCADTVIDDDDSTNQRPDYLTDIYDHYVYSYSSCVDELKTKTVSGMKAIVDFYRLGIFAKGMIEQHGLNGLLVFQTIDSETTFYFMVENGGFFNLLEVVTIEIPMVKRNIDIITTYLDELYTVTCLHESIKKIPQTRPSSPTLPFSYIRHNKKTLTGKEKPALASISTRSKKGGS